MLARRLVVVSGKGGTGKSALAAAISLAAQRKGQRVLAVAMTQPGQGLATHLGAPPLDVDPVEVRPGLSAMAVDRTEALLDYLEVQVGLPPLMRFGPAARAFDALASAAPAVREIVTIGKVLWEVRQQRWDLVVADAPPAGQIGSYLRAARTITDLVPSGRIREQAAWMQDLLSDPDATTLALVTLPEELPTAETREMLGWLDDNPVVTEVSVIANRVLPHLEPGSDPLPTGPAGDAARLHLDLTTEQSRWLGVVPADHLMPFLFGVMTPTEVAARMADEIERWETP